MTDSQKKRPYLQYGLTVAVLVGLVVAAARYLNGAEVLNAMRSFNYALMPLMLLLSTGDLLLKAWRFVLLLRPVSAVRPGIAFRAYLAGQAVTLLPGGVAGRAGLMKQAGVPVAKSGGPVLFSSVLDQSVFIGGSLLAALWFEAARGAAIVLLGVVAGVALVVLMPATRRQIVTATAWIAGKLNVAEQWQDFLETLPAVTAPRLMISTLVLTVIAFALNIVIFDFSLRGLGETLPYPMLFLAFFLPTMFGRIFPLPGGIGVTEASMVGFLASTSPIDVDTAAAAVAIFRIVVVPYSAGLGALVYFFAWRGEREAAASPAP